MLVSISIFFPAHAEAYLQQSKHTKEQICLSYCLIKHNVQNHPKHTLQYLMHCLHVGNSWNEQVFFRSITMPQLWQSEVMISPDSVKLLSWISSTYSGKTEKMLSNTHCDTMEIVVSFSLTLKKYKCHVWLSFYQYLSWPN